jgi:GTP cyclohydrolase-4
LPSTYRAAQLSRNLEALKKVLWKQDEHQLRLLSINNIGSKIVNQLLINHIYSTKVHVDISLDYFSKRFSPERKIINHEPFRIKVGATSIRKSKQIITKHSLQVIVKGATTCPCAQNQSKFITLQKMKELEINIDGKLIENLIFPTHMQRAVVTIRFEDMDDNNLDIENLITIAESSISNSTQSLLKRDDEEQLILNPKFVEDVVRAAAYSIAHYPQNFGKDTKIYISAETQESIHKHDAFSEIFMTYLDLKNYK